MYNKLLAVVSGLILLLSSCTVGKKYQRAELNMPEQYRVQQAAVTADTIQLPWRTFFKDAQLVALIEKALTKNNEIGVALKNMEQLDLSFRQAKLGLLPTLDLNAGFTRSYLSKNTLNGSMAEQFIGSSYMDDFNASLRLSWEADIWGKAKMQKEAARAGFFAQRENLAALRTRIISQVAQAYYNLLSLDEQLRIADRNIVLSDSTLRMVQLQYRSGRVNSLAVGQAEAQKKTAELLVPLAHQNIAMQENALSILCGEYPDNIARTGEFKHVTTVEIFPAGAPAWLLSRRPDVKAAEYAVVAANAKTGLAKAAMYPTFSLTPQVGANALKFNNWFDLPGSLTKTLAVNLTQPIFQKRALRTAYEVAALEQEKSVLQFRQSVLAAVGEVSDAMARSKHASERLELIAQKTNSLDKATKDALLLFKSGMATYLEVITAQNNALQNELEAVNILKDKLTGVVELYRALGGGVE